MSSTPLDRRFVPLQQAVPRFEVVRIRAEARAAELARDSGGAAAQDRHAAVALYGTELRVQSADGLIAGRIDRVIETPSGPVLQDYKSGAIFTLLHGLHPELNPAYAIQLRLYAALYHEATKSWPSRLEVVPLRGAPQEVPFSPADSVRLLDDARALLDEVNAEVTREGDWDEIESSLAVPSPSACRFCTYRPACLSYLTADQSNANREWPADRWGRFGTITRLGNGRLMLSISLAQGSRVFVRDLSNSNAEDMGLLSLDQNAFVGVFNLRRTQSPFAFEEGPLTMIYHVTQLPRREG
jgi:hypothetical protein